MPTGTVSSLQERRKMGNHCSIRHRRCPAPDEAPDDSLHQTQHFTCSNTAPKTSGVHFSFPAPSESPPVRTFVALHHSSHH